MGIKRWYELVALILEARDIVHLKIVEGFVFLSTLSQASQTERTHGRAYLVRSLSRAARRIVERIWREL
jgi:hypothetical protein